MDDLISRQQEIDALDCINGAEEVLRSLPSAQPNLQTTCNQLATDLISRQAAIDALNKQIQQCRKALGSLSLSDVDKHAVEVKMASLRAYRKMLENLPTIQPEVLACGNGELVAKLEPTDIDAKEAVYNLAEKIGIHQLFALTVELMGEPIQPELTDEQVIDYCGKKGYKIVADDLFDLLSKPEPHWIPVSERLPEDTQYVLLTVRRLNNAYNSTPFISVGYIGWNQQHWWCAHDGDCEISKVEVLAWMPLPEPYKPNKKQSGKEGA